MTSLDDLDALRTEFMERVEASETKLAQVQATADAANKGMSVLLKELEAAKLVIAEVTRENESLRQRLEEVSSSCVRRPLTQSDIMERLSDKFVELRLALAGSGSATEGTERDAAGASPPSTMKSVSRPRPRPSRVEALLGGRARSYDSFGSAYNSVGTVYGQEEEEEFNEDVEADISPQWLLDFDEIEFGEERGSGAFSTVYEGHYRGTHVAIKKLRIESLQYEEFITTFKKEVALLSTLEHPNVVRFIGVCTFPSYYMVTAFMALGGLDDLLHDRSQSISWKQRLSFCRDIACGMRYLHGLRPRIIHRDLKCANVLVDRNWTAHVTDFGLSIPKQKRLAPMDLKEQWGIRMSMENALHGKSASYIKPSEQPIGTFPFIAPELLESKPYNEYVDVYSYALVLYHIMTREWPGAELSQSTFERMELTETYRPGVPEWVPEVVRSLIESCWDETVAARPSFDRIVTIIDGLAEEEEPTIAAKHI